jgi:peroxiredoxin
MGTGILEPGAAVLDFTLPDARTGEPFALSSLRGRKNAALIFFRGLW